MSQQSAIWGHIRAGQAPTPRRVDDVIARSALILGRDGVEQATARLGSAVLGAGPLDPLLADEAVTDVLVNGTLGVFVDRGDGLTPCAVEIGDEEAVRRLAVRLAGLARRRLDEASPYVDGLLPGGVRLHAVLPPLVDGGAHISLRVPRRRVSSLEQLQAHGSFPRDWMPVLDAIIAGKHSYVVTGGTGTGKTTLLAALLARVPQTERLLVVEDVRELHVQHPHAVRMQTRPPNVEGAGHVDMVALVRQSLRMRPDRLVVGEVRGAEVREMLTALNTGHEGGCGTLHANSSLDVVARFEALGALAGMTPEATRCQLASAVSLVIHLRRGQRRRYIECIGVLGEIDGELAVLPALMQDAPPADAADTEPIPRVCEPGWDLLAAMCAGQHG
ncbi:pilus assembly protein CpaF [Kineosphaera limosa]|uniref:Bacterial type II secretion system protein E domain-containing protein n=1 Tax=Kineosphaera limosa NBRC 100340 TaxID=1184609 RepID=K6VPV3_9MICO|nr:TadA family conjugal transfer-associated ATPase [Kineosphaera limosa]NYE01639.1 pilus assembly protein CpaF [Kineosphaera limosa]GAB98238.1 hypothetical protein KILIM_116_00020 [Kineosphaera limosa NBRC 100340]